MSKEVVRAYVVEGLKTVRLREKELSELEAEAAKADQAVIDKANELIDARGKLAEHMKDKKELRVALNSGVYLISNKAGAAFYEQEVPDIIEK